MAAVDLLGAPRTWARRLGWATLAGVALGVLGPFGSFLNGDAVARIAYWTGLTWTGAVVLGLVVGPAVRAAPRAGVPVLFAAAVATLLACTPLSMLVALVGRTAWTVHTAGLRPLDWYAQTLFVSAPLVAVTLWLESPAAFATVKGDATDGRPEPASEAPAPPGHEGRLPRALREAAVCLQMEDHYVRVHTAQGSELRLLPMRAAVQALGEERGLQVHRSWWVARSALVGSDSDSRGTTLRLSNGLTVPVARNRVALLKAQGWLQ